MPVWIKCNMMHIYINFICCYRKNNIQIYFLACNNSKEECLQIGHMGGMDKANYLFGILLYPLLLFVIFSCFIYFFDH